MFCTKCGKQNEDNAVFCAFCGERMIVVSVASSEGNGKVSLGKPTESNVGNVGTNVGNTTGNAVNVINPSMTGTNTGIPINGQEMNTGIPQSQQNGQYHKEYLFVGRKTGKDLELGPITLAEGYRAKTSVTVDLEKMDISQTRSLGKNKEKTFQINKITDVNYGFYVMLLYLIVAIFFIAFFFTVPNSQLISFVLRFVIVAVFFGGLFPASKYKMSIISNTDKITIDCGNSATALEFIEDLKNHPSFSGRIAKNKYIIQKILLVVLVVVSLLFVIKPDFFTGSQMYEGTYQEWVDAGYPKNYKTIIAADVTFATDDSENDSITVLTGDNFEENIWITDSKGTAIKDWDWLHKATPLEGNYAFFEITLTRFENNKIIDDYGFEWFIYKDPVALTEEEYVEKYGNKIGTEVNENDQPIVTNEQETTNNIEPTNDIEPVEDVVQQEETVENQGMDTEIMNTYTSLVYEASAYSICYYSLYDFDNDGIEELIVSYGDTESDFVNDVYTVDDNKKEKLLGSFNSRRSFYEAEDGNGIYAVYGYMWYEGVVQIYLKNGQLQENSLWGKDIGYGNYYSNDKPIQQYYPNGELYQPLYTSGAQFDYMALAGAYMAQNSDSVFYISIYSSPEGDGSVGTIENPDSSLRTTLWKSGIGSTMCFECSEGMYLLSFVSDSSFELLWFDEIEGTYKYCDVYRMIEHFES